MTGRRGSEQADGGTGVRRRELRFTPGDARLIGLLHRLGWCLGDDLAVGVGRPGAKVRQRLSLLRSEGWVTYDRPTLGPAAWRATRQGLGVAGVSGRPAPPLTAAGRLHQVTVAALVVRCIAGGLEVTTERELHRNRRAGALGTRVPDFVVEPEGLDIAVELELTAKSARRVDAILSAYARSGRRVLYLVTPDARRAVEAASERLFGAARIRVRPAPVVRRADGSMQPDREAAKRIVAELVALSAARPVIVP